MNIYEELEGIKFANYEKFDKYERDVTLIFDRYDQNTLVELYIQVVEKLLIIEREYEHRPCVDSDYECGCIFNVLKEYLRENICNKKVESELSHYI